MNKISEQLIQLSDKLDKAGKTKCANAIDGLIEHQSLAKVAQYIGVIGYVLKQNRAMGNCIRKKRVSSTGSMQEVVLGCLKEYQDGQQYDNNEWTSKYAQVIRQLPDQFPSAHIDFFETLAEENNITQHIARVKQAQNMLIQEQEQDPLINQIVFDLASLDRVLKEGDVNPRPFKVAAPPSPRSRWSRFWSPSWRPSGKDKDTQFEMDAILESLMNIQNDIQQIRGGISRMRYDSRGLQDPRIQQLLRTLSDTNWEQTTNGIHNLGQALGALQQGDPTVSLLGRSLSQIKGNIDKIFDEVRDVQKNMYNLRLRDPVKGRGSLKSATEEYGDLARTLDRLYINPLDERSLHYSLKFHGRLEDTLNDRAGAKDPSFDKWVNAPELELGRSRYDAPNAIPASNPSAWNQQGTMEDPASPAMDSVLQMASDPTIGPRFMKWLDEMAAGVHTLPETKQAINVLRDLLREKQQNATQDTTQNTTNVSPSSDVTSVQTPPKTREEVLAGWRNENVDLLDFLSRDNLNLLNPQKQGFSASSLQKLAKIADALNEWDGDLAALLREYIEKEEDQLPKFPSMSSIIKEQEDSRRKII